MFDLNRDECRQFFFTTWQKKKNLQTLSQLEQQIVEIIETHPEYHAIICDPEQHQQENYRSDNNPFLHLSLHLGLQEQINTNRPQGVQAIYRQLLMKHQDQHAVAHQMMEILARVLWDAQQHAQLPDEEDYLMQLQQIIKSA